MFENPSQEKIFQILKEAKNIAVVGLSPKEDRVSFQIARLLQNHGYRIIPVNPQHVDSEILGEKVYADLASIPDKIDIVDIFRRSEFLPEVAADFLKTDAKVFWAQLGLQSEQAWEMLQNAGRNDVIMNRCIKIELNKMV
ncbi:MULTISPECIES: CoA-binding protein [Enterococcus]|uniref:CoA-binding protein n=1 Tax=Enterococcus dispar ATCC 51266 TaxID=1139219 RepID=S0KVB3_9ENTE|nr:CoA-binding protein [Enterococcus dispar]EOT43141.1 CoA-binding protein [Enterococcus dispar ATCC 51266]EOW85411.1 CoA-binding protein [Enterococcus dispar ATCC 51266]MCU7358549.1 CoA-binding protein [Enterococcus dispar]OJG37875.1 CoA-binding protein [Enterococcus dispar]